MKDCIQCDVCIYKLYNDKYRNKRLNSLSFKWKNNQQTHIFFIYVSDIAVQRCCEINSDPGKSPQLNLFLITHTSI